MSIGCDMNKSSLHPGQTPLDSLPLLNPTANMTEDESERDNYALSFFEAMMYPVIPPNSNEFILGNYDNWNCMPIAAFEQEENGREHLAITPLFRFNKYKPPIYDGGWDVTLSPLFNYQDNYRADYRWYALWPFISAYGRKHVNSFIFFPLCMYKQREKDIGKGPSDDPDFNPIGNFNDWDMIVTPLIYYGNSEDNGPYFMFFPIGGWTEGLVGYERLTAVLFPLYAADKNDWLERLPFLVAFPGLWKTRYTLCRYQKSYLL